MENRSTSSFILVTKHFRAAGDFLCVVRSCLGGAVLDSVTEFIGMI